MDAKDEIEKLIRGMNSEILKLSQIDQMEIAMKRVEELRGQGKTDDEIGANRSGRGYWNELPKND